MDKYRKINELKIRVELLNYFIVEVTKILIKNKLIDRKSINKLFKDLELKI